MRLTGFADISLECAQKAAAESQGSVAVSDYRDLFPFVDAVVVAVPHDLHFAIGSDCLRAGKHVLMEKPLALTEEQCRALIRMDTSPTPVLMVGYVLRHDPLWQAMGDLIRRGVYGQVFHAAIWTEQLTDAARHPWYGNAKRAGGGQLFSHGCHYIDMLIDWLGAPVCGSHVSTNLGTPGMDREGTSNVCLKFRSGATGYHFGTWGARGSYLRYSAEAHAEEGLLHLDHDAGVISLYRQRTPAEIFRRAGPAGKPVAEQMGAFLDCIEKKQKPAIGAAAAFRSLQVIWKLYEAEDRGQVADLSGIFPAAGDASRGD
jgi:predicted dehydrogenase